MNASSRAVYLMHIERRMALLTHWGLMALSAWLWWPERQALLVMAFLFVLVISFVTLRPPQGWSRRQVFVFSSISYIADVLLAALASAAPAADFSLSALLMGMLFIRAIPLTPIHLWPLALPILFWPLALLNHAASITWSPETFVAPLLLSGIGVGLAIWYRQAVIDREILRRDLQWLETQHAQQQERMHQVTNRLARELLVLRGLREGARAISGQIAFGKQLDMIARNAALSLGDATVFIALPVSAEEVRIRATSGHIESGALATLEYLAQESIRTMTPIRKPATMSLGGPFVCLPLTTADVPIGVIGALGNETRLGFSEEEIERLSAFADQAALAITQSRLYEELREANTDKEQRLRQLEAIYEAAKAAVSVLESGELMQRLLQQMVNAIQADAAAVFMYDKNDGDLRRAPEAAIGPLPPFPSMSEPMWIRALKTQEPVLVLRSEEGTHPGDQVAQAWGMATYMVIPLVGRQESLGVLYVARREHAAFTPQDRQLAESLASFAATALENVDLYRRLHAQWKQLRGIVQNIGDGLIVIDLEGRILLTNPTIHTVLELDEAAFEGRTLQEIPQLRGLHTLVTNVLTTLDRDPHMGRVTVSYGPHRPKRIFEAVVNLMTDENDQPTGVVATLRDITAKHELEEMKSNFVSVISHELRTPLHSISGFIKVILDGKAGPINDLQRDFLETVRDQTQHLYRLIEDLLEFNRLESGQIQLHLEPIAVNTLLSETLEIFRPEAEQRSIELKLATARGLGLLEGDRGRLRQVLSNLISNALKFTPSGGTVELGAKDEGKSILIWVRDTGIGIPPEEQKRIFDRFYQVDSSLTREHRGAGLGLAIAKHIVTQHGGEIWVESEEQKGSTFFVRLPREVPKSEPVLDFASLTSPKKKQRDA
ncbi:two-component system, OmpR family, phosphate regulon sensor histidine kinase PhoR [Ardenticatena maritima]|uniref:histidine kinase n=3 Tax=Ardenticatena maritima TaxID=872965 RepID=A0A0M8K697_9CHLR|nr:ATP-binding protein [Ardenticatena maritima]KPL87635.1 hypothetical protein SE16_08390 [Ardenticatena maritima]GAP61661.1 two-component system, OmpR family, phosphate regulon sensor histidine kinase PhoR [Ardenticatena maritima]